ncbi:MBL fold metallo-hydrolase [Jiella pacifica]|uniref:MBL fold metallo-hydrolase n=1 Tax=Jiella pacifica TaxID=2696469 RepID=A0A6N9TEX2_9HYPH|nr:MBL fold metallo-hydrolase [Jiella pacifica]NDW07408.1 MBL fold metallo-hydrolase [Jiella pacifica]
MWLAEHPLDAPLREVLAAPPGARVQLFWLGQAGFVVEGGGRRVVIDPYLSDSLAEKYRGARFAHVRMMPAPVEPCEILHVDAMLATHAHTDHLDPGTLPQLLANNLDAPLIVPKSALAVALQRSCVPKQRLIGIDAGETCKWPGLSITAVRAAHETLERDDQGFYRFLGLAVRLGGATVYHSGDTVPFDGQVEEVRELNADLALLPVNGRDAVRASNGVPGNMSVEEALDLCRATGIGAMIAHHFDLFAFNTVPRETVEALASRSDLPHAVAARLDRFYSLGPEQTG